MKTNGKLIVFEGIDGSGKATQSYKLAKRLLQEKKQTRFLSFPRYNEDSSVPVRMYLAGEIGKDADAVNPYAVSTFYAIDRFVSYATDWKEVYEDGGLIVCDRYTTSNICHQGSKLPQNELTSFIEWIEEYEYDLLELPRPDMVIYVDTDLDVAVSNIKARGDEEDIHERSINYLRKTQKTGRLAAEHLGWKVIKTVKHGVMRPADEIQEEIYAAVAKIL